MERGLTVELDGTEASRIVAEVVADVLDRPRWTLSEGHLLEPDLVRRVENDRFVELGFAHSHAAPFGSLERYARVIVDVPEFWAGGASRREVIRVPIMHRQEFIRCTRILAPVWELCHHPRLGRELRQQVPRHPRIRGVQDPQSSWGPVAGVLIKFTLQDLGVTTPAREIDPDVLDTLTESATRTADQDAVVAILLAIAPWLTLDDLRHVFPEQPISLERWAGCIQRVDRLVGASSEPCHVPGEIWLRHRHPTDVGDDARAAIWERLCRTMVNGPLVDELKRVAVRLRSRYDGVKSRCQTILASVLHLAATTQSNRGPEVSRAMSDIAHEVRSARMNYRLADEILVHRLTHPMREQLAPPEKGRLALLAAEHHVLGATVLRVEARTTPSVAQWYRANVTGNVNHALTEARNLLNEIPTPQPQSFPRFHTRFTWETVVAGRDALQAFVTATKARCNDAEVFPLIETMVRDASQGREPRDTNGQVPRHWFSNLHEVVRGGYSFGSGAPTLRAVDAQVSTLSIERLIFLVHVLLVADTGASTGAAPDGRMLTPLLRWIERRCSPSSLQLARRALVDSRVPPEDARRLCVPRRR